MSERHIIDYTKIKTIDDVVLILRLQAYLSSNLGWKLNRKKARFVVRTDAITVNDLKHLFVDES